MTQVENLRLFFIINNENGSEDDCSEDMKAAYECVVEYGGKAEWVPQSFCLQHNPSLSDVFVFEKFDGKGFDHLKKNSAKVLGAKCLWSCVMEGRSIPPGASPIFTEGMRGLVVCCTGFDANTKKQIKEKVLLMAGMFDDCLRSITTHVVAMNSVSTKATEALKGGKKVMKLEWVDTVWEKSKEHNVNGDDEQFNILKVPLFHNVRITTSGISKKEKDKIRDLTTRFGGTFTGELEEKRTNIVLISKPEGEKYKYATSWKIACVKPQWLYDCVESATTLPVSGYSLGATKPKASTPKKNNMSDVTANFSMISNIGHANDRYLTHLDETAMSATVQDFLTPRAAAKENHPSYVEVVDELMRRVRESGQFLDGCNIFLFGFSPECCEKLRKVLNLSGATRFDELSRSVTHVVVGSQHNMDVDGFKGAGASVVSVEWLRESMRLRRPAPEESFLLFDPSPRSTEPPSPLSKQGAQMLSKTIQQPDFNVAEEEEDRRDELLLRYNQSQQGEPLKQAETTAPFSRSTTLKTETTDNEDFFSGLKFYLSGELSAEEATRLEELIVERGGEVVGKRFSGVPDYAVVPIIGASLADVTTREVVNSFFIKDCCIQQGLVEVQYYHQPVACTADASPLKHCVITVSNYAGSEREFIELIVESLGAVSQSLLARKAKDTNILKSTHLVCDGPSGQKYNGALRWGLPVVHHDWLLKCASLGIRVSEQPFLVGDSKLSASLERTPSVADSVTSLPRGTPQNSTVSRAVATPSTAVNHAVATPPCSAVNRAVARLRQLGTPQNLESPDMNRTVTPTSPYGAFYGNDNPSPGTRKRLAKWMSGGADFPVDPPTNYEAYEEKPKDSTPLSVLLTRQLLLMKRSAEDLPPDSPVSSSPKRPALDLTGMNSSSPHVDIAAGLQKLKELEEKCKELPRKLSEPGPSPQQPRREEVIFVEESQPHTEVGWEYPLDKDMKLLASQEKLFMLSGLGDDVEETKRLIIEAGGKVSELLHFDNNATHIIVASMTRCEKLMGSIASGLWVLQTSYLDELRRTHDVNLVQEALHEWGRPDNPVLDKLSLTAKESAHSSYVWRKEVQQGGAKPFNNMKFILLISSARQESFKRLLEAGDGTVISVREIPSLAENVICVLEVSLKNKVDLDAISKKGINCVSQLFINDHILKKPDALKKNLISISDRSRTK